MKPISVFNYSVKNQSDGCCDIAIDGAIVDAESQQWMELVFGDTTSVSYKSLRQQVEQSGCDKINFTINSGGGSVVDAMAIHDWINELITSGKQVTCKGIGIVASAATYILMADPKCTMTENSWMMIHNVSGWTGGDVNTIENYAKMMRKFNDTVTSFYANKTGLSADEIGTMMNAETWLTAKDCETKGFINKCTPSVNFTNSIKPEHWQFKNTTVLNHYNSFIKNDTMDFKKLSEELSNAIKNGFAGLKLTNTENKEVPVDSIATAISNSIAESLKPMENSIEEKVKAAVENALKGEGFTNAITEATKDFTNKTELEVINQSITDLKNDVSKMSGKPLNTGNGGGGKVDDEKPSFKNHTGITFQEA